MSTYDALLLFSGGLDSVLCAKLLQEQGLRVLGLHCVSPFFGKPQLLDHWRDIYGLDIVVADIGRDVVNMLKSPANGYGKHLNPCVDCKILMLRHARGLLRELDATFLATGEVLGQRPMSQRENALNLIRRDAGVRGLLLRPLSANKLKPTPMELSGLVDRARLPGVWGRGRRDQLALAEHFRLPEIPTPGGGCRLSEAEPAARYFPILMRLADPAPEDFLLSHAARQYWAGPYWLSIGRNEQSNQALEALARPGDILFRMKDVTGPLGLARQYAPATGWPDADPTRWPQNVLADAAAFIASYASHARAAATPDGRVAVLVIRQGETEELAVAPARVTPLNWRIPRPADIAAWKKSRV